MSKTAYNLTEIKDSLYAAVISDALDSLGYTCQSPDLQFNIHIGHKKIVGRCKTTLWTDIDHIDPNPYELELEAVDTCQEGDIFIAAASGSCKSGIWGELLSTAARNSGCEGAIIDGCVRDIDKIQEMGFTVFARGKSIYDSQNRQTVINLDVPVSIGGVLFHPGDLVFCDQDGVVVIPQEIEAEVIEKAMQKVTAENITRNEIINGMKAKEAYHKYGVL